jgi:tetratricopeptide (TPR) repeat protein
VGVPRRVFLSHTGELREFPLARSFLAAAEHAVSRAGDSIGDMAYFTARDDKPADYCQAQVRECDVYVGLIGLRYGSPVRDRSEVSYTELEFDTATEAGKPRLVFLIDEDAAVPIPPGRLLDRDPELQARQRAFRNKVLNSGVLAAKFASPEQLEVLLLQALQNLLPEARPSEVGQTRLWRAPPRNSGFTGRDSLIANMREALLDAPTGMVVLQGPGGVGKTQLSIEYAYRFVSHYDIVWVINAEQPELITRQLAELAAAMGAVTSISDAQVAATAAVTELRARSRWLLVFDNTDNPDDLPDFLPDKAGHVLGTTRTGVWQETAEMISVEEFSRTESITLLTSRVAALTLADADSLASALGGLPIALAQAASVLQLLPAADFQRLLDTRAAHILSQEKPRSYPASLAASTIIAEEKLAGTNPAAANLLCLCCYLAPESIPGAWFYNVGKLNISPTTAAQIGPLPDGAWEVSQGFGKIRDIGLGRTDQAGLRLHRLTQAILRDHTADNQTAYRDLIVAVLVAAAPDDSENPSSWADWSRLVSHLLPAISEGMPAVLRRTACAAARYLIVSGQAKAALTMTERMHELWMAELGADNFDSLTAAQLLAHASHDLGDYEAALELQEETLGRRTRVLGEDHPDTLQSKNDLAATLWSLGRYSEALPLSQETYDRRRRVLGEDHRHALQSAANLAEVVVALGRYREALPLSQDAYDRARRVLGEDHPTTVYAAAGLDG